LSFFFSSRRRHTRFSRDWSSDVCSSDLLAGRQLDALALHHQLAAVVFVRLTEEQGGRQIGADPVRRARHAEHGIVDMVAIGAARSEERRVGKEWRAGGQAEQWRRMEAST